MRIKLLPMKRAVRTALLVLLLSAAGMTKTLAQSFTVGNLNYSVNSDGVSVTLTGHVDGTSATGALVIPETVVYNGTVYPVTTIGYGAFNNCSGLTGSLTIPNSVTTLGDFAFTNCNGFSGNLTLGNSITEIGGGAFLGCSGFLGNLYLPNSVTEIGGSAFRNCSGFTGSLNIPNSVITINQWAFENCSGFTGNLSIGNSVVFIFDGVFSGCSGFTGSLTIGNSVTMIGDNAFRNCSGFTGNLIIPNSVTTIGYQAFYNCSSFNGSLTIGNSVTMVGIGAFENCNGFAGSLIIPNSVTTININAFRNCSGFTGSLTIGNSVTTIGESAFYNCSGFNGSLTIPNSVTTIGQSAFANCSGFTGSLTIPNSVTTIGDGTFYGCSGFTGSLAIPNSVTTIGYGVFSGCSGFNGRLTIGNSVTTIGDYAFKDCSGFTGSLTIPNSVVSIYDGAFSNCSGFVGDLVLPNSLAMLGNSVFSNCSGFSGTLIIPNTIATIGNSVFSNCRNITGSLIIPNSVSSIGIDAFRNCSGITGSLSIPNSVTTIGNYAFYGCGGFNGDLTIGNSVTTIGNCAFQDCSGFIGNLIIGNSVTTIGNRAFQDCSGFTGSLTIPSSVTMIGQSAFMNCSGFIGSLTIGNSVTMIDYEAFYNCSGFNGSLTIGNSVTTIGEYAFYNCSSFNGSLTIPNSVTTIGQSAFYNCSSFNGSLTIPNSVTTIGQSAFRNCSGFNGNLIIGNSVTTIGNFTFENCSGFTGSLTIGNSVTMIDDYAFFSCWGFTEIYSRCTIPPYVNLMTFYDVSKSIPIWVPCGTEAIYKRTQYWSEFTDYHEIPAQIIVSVNFEILGTATITQQGTCSNLESTVHAEANPNCIFTNWMVDGIVVSTEEDYTFDLTEDINLVANFDVAPNCNIFVGTNSNLWSDAGNWLPQQLPSEGSTVIFYADGEVDVEATVADVYFYDNLTIISDAQLTITGTINNMEEGLGITIEDGGQLHHNTDGITATIQKTITPYTSGTKDGWHLISHPMADNLGIAFVQNLTSNEYDLYYYDEPTVYWINQENPDNNYTQLEAGKGYLYGSNCVMNLDFDYGFEDGTLQGWTSIDADGDGYDWFAAAGTSTSHNGNGHIGSESWKYPSPGILRPDNYAISPQIQLGTTPNISFWACANDANYPQEHFGIAVSTTGNTDAADFVMVQEWTLSAKSGRSIGSWYQYTTDLSAFAGQQVYVAIRHFNCSGQDALLIDDITLSGVMESYEAMTLNFTGIINNGSATVNVPLSYTTGHALQGFNLVGNPFAHNVTSYASENVANGCYVMNEAKDDLIVSEISEENPLKPAEGFFVKATAAGASITFNPGRGSSATQSGTIRVELAENGKLIDRLLVKTAEGQPLEKFSLNERRTRLFAQGEHQELAIVPCEGNEQAVNFKAVKNGNYTIKVNIDDMELNYLHLIDNLTGADVDLLSEPSYTFEAKTSDYASRFLLRFIPKDNVPDNSETFAFFNGSEWFINNEGKATLQIIDITGRILSSESLNGSCCKNINQSTGVYMLRLIDGDNERTKKIVLE